MVINRRIINSKGVKVFNNAPKEFKKLNKDIIYKETKQNIHILAENFNKIKYLKKGNSISFGQWAKRFNYKDFQISELKRCYGAYIQYEVVKDSQIQLFLDRNLSSKFLERIYFLRTLVGSGVLPYLIIQFGITEAFKRFNNHYFRTNNPGKNHNGKLSAYSKNFIKYSHLSSEETNDEILKIQNKCKKTRQEHPENQNTRIEYYIKKYGDTEEALQKYYDRCNTRSKEAFVKRYGEIEGTLKFEKCVEKWLKTLNDKPIDEKIRINRAKASFISSKYKPGGIYENVKGICYYIRFYSPKTPLEFYKIGITKKTIAKRFKDYCIKGLFYEVLDSYEDTIYNCFLKEQNILKVFDSKRKNIILNGNQFTTEAFYEDILRGSKIENY